MAQVLPSLIHAGEKMTMEELEKSAPLLLLLAALVLVEALLVWKRACLLTRTPRTAPKALQCNRETYHEQMGNILQCKWEASCDRVFAVSS